MEEKEMQPKENKMGVLPINQLLISMSVPIMLSMLVQALYNVVDSVFVSRVSENALNAVSLAFSAFSLTRETKTLSTTLYSACTSILSMMGTDMLINS